jgi:FkbM family methyltransferase
MYFPHDLLDLGDNETFVDCGAFDGDSIQTFLDRTDGNFRRIYALEPDSSNRARLETYLSSLKVLDRQRVAVLPFAVSDFNGMAAFSDDGTVGSRLVTSAGALSHIECRRLDDLAQIEGATFVKMDIEGSEPAALSGASRLIQRERPVLAVCAYHRCEHLWTLPVLLARLLPSARIYLRRYAEECWETVFYAVPRERGQRHGAFVVETLRE